MSMPRIHWSDLPTTARAAVAEQTGTIHHVATAGGGANSAIAARVHADHGRYFVKGLAAEHPQALTQQREADINPHLPASCPRLLWRVRAAGWDLLGFELITGRTADYSPGSPDLPVVAAALGELAGTPCPSGLPLKQADQRWAAYTGADAGSQLAGDALLHTDLAPHNVLISGDRAHLIDWAWPTRGPAWIDPAVWVIRLIDDGHSPHQAEQWAAHTRAWHTAPRAALDMFADANRAMWRDIAHHEPATEWKQRIARSAQRWATHRSDLTNGPTTARGATSSTARPRR